ncbi:hypothetical protein FQN55_005404 [Onygenales sp. PD_40]|nr:hypothetical protein FQN55_005404 [Onygenales sp. PD_40]KAK2796181.1 hypothetical protein FQN52_000159 [Onygenales sp. PD_12]
MADRNAYLRYKRNEKLLIYWITHTSNSIIHSSPSTTTAPLNATGKISLSSLVSLSKLIAEHLKPIPAPIYRLFQAILQARKEAYAVFQRIFASNGDPEIEKRNESHKHWIDQLTEAFIALGGDSWASQRNNKTQRFEDGEDEKVIFSNKFSSLPLEGDTNCEGQGDGETDSVDEASAKLKRKPVKKGRKGKRDKNKKSGGKQKTIKKPTLDDVPFESYHIIEDDSSLFSAYQMGAYTLLAQWIELRDYIQRLWRHVAYDGLNSVVAATLSNIATSYVDDTEYKIFLDFPGHDSFETVTKIVTRGDPNKAAQEMLGFTLDVTTENETSVDNMTSDIKDQLLLYTYYNLLDFVSDFQMTRSGKPTKNMLAEIKNWDPMFNMKQATHKEQLKWLRAYTINWLYDLVNVFSSDIIRHEAMRGQNTTLEKMDWSANGRKNDRHRLFGLNKFAGEITMLAMQKPSTDIRSKILPHHVFQLQCIVDSFAVSRGWTPIPVKSIAPAQNFHPPRDIDLFMGHENKPGSFYHSVNMLSALLKKDEQQQGNQNRHKPSAVLLTELRDDLKTRLGERKYFNSLTTIPPSRFSGTNSNGLWDYSPYLCGMGLIEALELAYSLGVRILDRMWEPFYFMHLYRVLVQEGHIQQDDPMHSFMKSQQALRITEHNLGDSNLRDSKPAFVSLADKTGARGGTHRRRITQTTLDRAPLSFFSPKSLLEVYREANWIPDRISDGELPLGSTLARLRIAGTKRVTNPETGEVTFESTRLVKGAKADGMTDESLMQFTWEFLGMERTLHGDVWLNDNDEAAHLSLCLLLRMVTIDIARDVAGEGEGEDHPLSGINYLSVAFHFAQLFNQIEQRLGVREQGMALTRLALKGEDQEFLRVIAEEFRNSQVEFKNHVYWKGLKIDPSWLTGSEDDPAGRPCHVM